MKKIMLYNKLKTKQLQCEVFVTTVNKGDCKCTP